MERNKEQTKRKKRRARLLRKLALPALAAIFLMAVAVGGTIAYLTANTENVTNTFTPGQVSCEVVESFDGTTKTNITVKNTGNVPAFVRIKLVTYRVNENNQPIGGTAQIAMPTIGADWEARDGYYYYTKPVQPNATPDTYLVNSITLTESYDDADGGKQAVEVMAEAIQAEPTNAVQDAWGFVPSAQ